MLKKANSIKIPNDDFQLKTVKNNIKCISFSTYLLIF